MVSKEWTRKVPKPIYRTTLSADMIRHIMHLAKKELATNVIVNTASAEIVTKFAPLLAKVENDGLTPAYTTTPKPTVEQSLGMEPSVEELCAASKEVFWEACYQKYSRSPTDCTLEEIEAAREHMYLNDLMTEAQVTAFESTDTLNSMDSIEDLGL